MCAAEELNVGWSTVHDTQKNEAKLQHFMTKIEDGECIKKRRTVRRADLHELDEDVYLWFVHQRCKGILAASSQLATYLHVFNLKTAIHTLTFV